jgi:hypothetical protein
MNLGSLVALLRSVETFAETLGANVARDDLRELRALFAGHDKETAARFVTKLAKGKGAILRPVASEPVLRLQQTLSNVQTLLSSANSKAASNDIELVIGLLEGCDCASIAEFVEQAKRWLNVAPAKKARSAKKEVADDLPVIDPVPEYAQALKNASNDNAAFDQVVAKLKADKKRVRMQEMREIAKHYLGYELAKKKGRGDALQEIVDRQALDARQEARGRSHDRLRSW